MNTNPKRPRGRPVVDVDFEQVAELAKLGLSVQTIADRLGVSRRTLFNRLEQDPSARAIYDGGVADLVTLAAGQLRKLVERGDLGAIALVLRTRGSFVTPRQEVAVTISQPAQGPLIDSHVMDMIEEHRRLLDGPNPDDE
jgi:hypothetical protein